ncbi:unnamed protein product [Spirodela intermedia]|uniref:Uncharacterized protein n=2 Tax=Spirodela intermedia TaxID=51605 RepID=A0A7I8J741_SPIIN|nr:unnamed protein product [Spirodela intermedia]CAA6666068.1 unnamed protein product [Spirodela intermedia]CAA7402830.1 unnamed protein product [Spirodela intermedia]
MGEGNKDMPHGVVINGEEEDEELFGPVSSSSGSEDSLGSSTSSDLTDDASSSSPSGSPPPPSSDQLGPLFGLSSLMTHLPAKRGLSNYFSGKSQSFTSFSSVRCVEDLAKKEIPFRRKMKPCKSYGGIADLSNRSSHFAPGPCSKAISKKNSRSSCASLATRRINSGSFCSPKPPLIPIQKNM